MSWKPLILCVDDTPSVLEGLKMLLEENGYRVLTATNGKEACKLSRRIRWTWCSLTSTCQK